MSGARTEVAVCAILKNEAANVLEWVAHHHALGVERFHLYDNGSTDDTAARLAPLVRAGLVELTPWPQRPGQVAAYDDFARRRRDDIVWAAFIDLDEYINPFGFGSIPHWLSTTGDAAAVALQWLNFGPAGRETPPVEGLQTEAYRLRLPDGEAVHGHVKTVVRMSRHRRCLGAHVFEVEGVVADEYGRPVVAVDGQYAIQPVLPHAAVCLNHYYTRSRADWARKVALGRADNDDPEADQRRPEWFDHYATQATVPDDRILRFADRTREALRALSALP